MTPAQQRAVLGVRLCGVLLMGLALWQLAGNIASTYRDVDPSYLGYYFSTQILRPVCGILTGAALWAVSRPLGKLLARGLDK